MGNEVSIQSIRWKHVERLRKIIRQGCEARGITIVPEEATPPVAASDIPLEEGDRVKASLIEGGGSRRLTEGVLNGENAV